MTSLPSDSIELFNDSFERVRGGTVFFDRFYARLTTSSKEMMEFFVDSDLDRVKIMARDAFFFVLMASDGSARGERKLRELGMLHRQMSIQNNFYDVWLNALISVVEEMDPQYDLRIDRAWREVMGIGIGIMKSV